MRILVVNGNTTQSITDLVEREARLAAAADTEIVAVTATFGPRVITTRVEDAIAAHAVMALVARHHRGCDAVLIAISFDTGLWAAREMLPIAVVGMTEASLLTACMIGSKVGMVTFGRRSAPIYRSLVEGYGLWTRVVAIQPALPDAVEAPAAAIAIDNIADAANRLVDNHGVEAVVLTGAQRAGIPRQVQDRVPVPVLDGVSSGIRMAELMARGRFPKPRTGSLAPLPEKELTDIDPAITEIFARPRTS